ncbi:MAG: tRNA pseudouridine(38-40) synthase TruA [Candidatus Omnitrophica bacterium]|nr:tRNA pseudouridine(38-40) synthase TruA [Candidatus Omnitrophota bacterium]
MRNIRLVIEYAGTHYCGWQTQTRNTKTPSIQSTVEKTLCKILREKIKLIGAGRTDAGVHALGQVANFHTRASLSTEKLQRALNALLPSDITIVSAKEVPLAFHSRFRAHSKHYRYTILNRAYRSCFIADVVYLYPVRLDVACMQREADALIGTHDFRAFQAAGTQKKATVRTIKRIKISKQGDLVYIDIEAGGFLYNMARNIVGTLIEIGRHKFPRGSVTRILKSKDRRCAGPTAPAHGLCLVKVKY